MKQAETINESIANRELYTSFDEGTYYNMDLFVEFCNTRDLKRVAIFGYYKPKYRWTDAEAEEMYAKAPDGWTDGTGTYRLYDWGKGENKVISDLEKDLHEPHLDHIVPRSKGGNNHPSNFQVLPNLVNRILSNLTDELAPALLPIVVAQFGFTLTKV